MIYGIKIIGKYLGSDSFCSILWIFYSYSYSCCICYFFCVRLMSWRCWHTHVASSYYVCCWVLKEMDGKSFGFGEPSWKWKASSSFHLQVDSHVYTEKYQFWFCPVSPSNNMNYNCIKQIVISPKKRMTIWGTHITKLSQIGPRHLSLPRFQVIFPFKTHYNHHFP
jgi:hypothetical protein